MSITVGEKTKTEVSVPVAVYAAVAETDGAEIDLADGNYQAAAFEVVVGAWTDGTFTFTAQEASATGGPWTDVAAGDLSAAFTQVTDATTDDTVQVVDYLGSKQFLRAQSDAAGVTVGTILGIVIVQGNPTTLPAV